MADTTVDAVEPSGAAPIDEVTYKLEDWDDEAIGDVEEAVRKAGVTFRRDGFHMLVAADRLANSPSDLALCGDVVDAAGPARSMPTPFGVDENTWRIIKQQTSSLVDAIEVEDPDDVVGERARILSELLRQFV